MFIDQLFLNSLGQIILDDYKIQELNIQFFCKMIPTPF